MSYCVSMIPDWQAAIKEALRHLSPDGTLHIVDFGDQSRMPGWFNTRLRAWLMRFHVNPRDDLADMLHGLDAVAVDHRHMLRSYAQYASIRLAPTA